MWCCWDAQYQFQYNRYTTICVRTSNQLHFAAVIKISHNDAAMHANYHYSRRKRRAKKSMCNCAVFIQAIHGACISIYGEKEKNYIVESVWYECENGIYEYVTQYTNKFLLIMRIILFRMACTQQKSNVCKVNN